MSPLIAAFALTLTVTSQTNTEERAPLWLTFDVLNPDALGGHRVLHLDDILATRKTIATLPNAKSVLLFATTIAECSSSGGVCAGLAAIAQETKDQGGLVIAVLLDPIESLARLKKEVPGAHHPFPVIQDTRGITRRALRLDRPNEAVVINSEGRIVRVAQASEGVEGARKLAEAKKVFSSVLRLEKEE